MNVGYKRTHLLLFALLACLVSGCGSDLPKYMQEESIRNSFFATVGVTFEDGEAEEDWNKWWITNGPVYGDADEDGDMDAAVVLIQHGGGTGFFVRLHVLLDANGTMCDVHQIPLGDRVKVEQLAFNTESGEFVLDMVVQGLGDGLCCPSLPMQYCYSFLEDRLRKKVR